MKQDLKIIISGGGTGGHIFPAIAIANEIKKHNSEADILFIGAEGKMEMEKVPRAGYKIEGVPVRGFQRSLSLKNLTFLPRLLKSVCRSKKILKRFSPDVVVGTGGFVSGPVLYAATKKGIPSLIQEQNSYPGVTNKLLAKKVNKICVAYEEAKAFFPKEKVVITGNPISKAILDINEKIEEAFDYFGFSKNKPVLLVVGGSLGALAINEAIHHKLDMLIDNNVQVLWQTGKSYINKVNNKEELKSKGILVTDFIYRMDLAYAVATVIISRAGAMSISELEVVGKPAILVPSPYVAENHQYKNAMALVKKDAALLVGNDKAKENLVPQIISLLEDKEKQVLLAKNIKSLAKPEATEKIVKEIFNLINNYEKQ